MASIQFDAYNPGSQFRVGDAPGLRVHPITKTVEGHKGLDLPAAEGTDIPAAADGVVFANSFQYDPIKKTGWGWYVVLQHTRDDGSQFYTLYAHLHSESTLTVGDPVSAGSMIGEVGKSGGATGFHLHVEIIQQPESGVNVLSKNNPRLDVTSFTEWGGISHTIGTDNSGNPLVAQDSGSFDNGTWSRTVEN